MTRAHHLVRFGVGLTLCTGLLAAQGPALNLKLGLWETQMKMDMSQLMPGVDMSKMTPEQQAQMTAMMRMGGPGMAGAIPPVKTCMTREKLTSGNVAPASPGTTCTSTLSNVTATSADIAQVCVGKAPSTSQFHITAISTGETKMTGTSTTNVGGVDKSITVSMTSKWISADCGDIK